MFRYLGLNWNLAKLDKKLIVEWQRRKKSLTTQGIDTHKQIINFLISKICSCRKNHQRAMESMQASLESEQRSKSEALRIKKKLEGDINELEIALDHSNKANNEAQKSIKRYQVIHFKYSPFNCVFFIVTGISNIYILLGPAERI